MNTNNRFRSIFFLCVFSIAPVMISNAAYAQSQDYEIPPVFKASKILDPKLHKGPSHNVHEAVKNDGYMNAYKVSSGSGEFEVRGTLLLEKRI